MNEIQNVIFWILGTLTTIALVVGGWLMQSTATKIMRVEDALENVRIIQQDHAERLTKTETRYDDIMRRLSSIESKVDKILEK